MTAINCQSPLSGPNTTTQVLSRTQPQKACYQVRSPDAENDGISHQLWPSMPLIKRRQRGNKTIITVNILFSIFRKVDKNKKKKTDFITITNANNSRSKTEKPKNQKKKETIYTCLRLFTFLCRFMVETICPQRPQALSRFIDKIRPWMAMCAARRVV